MPRPSSEDSRQHGIALGVGGAQVYLRLAAAGMHCGGLFHSPRDTSIHYCIVRKNHRLSALHAMLPWLRDVVLGDPSFAGRPQPTPSSYEERHNLAQSILIPHANPKGASVNVVLPLSASFALTGRGHLESGKPKSGGGLEQLAGLGGPAAAKEERSHRHCVGGVVYTGQLDEVRMQQSRAGSSPRASLGAFCAQVGKLRLAAAVTSGGIGKATALWEPYLNGRVRLTGAPWYLCSRLLSTASMLLLLLPQLQARP